MCVCVCMCVELPQVSHPLILYCRGKSCLMEHSLLHLFLPVFLFSLTLTSTFSLLNHSSPHVWETQVSLQNHW